MLGIFGQQMSRNWILDIRKVGTIMNKPAYFTDCKVSYILKDFNTSLIYTNLWNVYDVLQDTIMTIIVKDDNVYVYTRKDIKTIQSILENRMLADIE